LTSFLRSLLSNTRVMKQFMLASFIVAFVAVACSRNAFTGRSQFTLLPESEVQAMSLQQYNQFLAQNKVVNPANNKNAQMVARIGKRIATAITAHYAQLGLATELNGYQWEYNLVDSKEINAWCMPGGKIVVYTGLLPVTQNEDALAVVMGHEVAHALGKHGNERMSKGLLQQFGGVALSVAVANKPEATQQLFLAAYGVGSNVGVILPFGRKQELEADKLGLRCAALAGYNVREAIPLWQRMGAMSGGQKPPEFLSTHPPEEKRIKELEKIMDETIRDYYRPQSVNK
jgi:predicted Zn-dependent protease